MRWTIIMSDSWISNSKEEALVYLNILSLHSSWIIRKYMSNFSQNNGLQEWECKWEFSRTWNPTYISVFHFKPPYQLCTESAKPRVLEWTNCQHKSQPSLLHLEVICHFNITECCSGAWPLCRYEGRDDETFNIYLVIYNEKLGCTLNNFIQNKSLNFDEICPSFVFIFISKWKLNRVHTSLLHAIYKLGTEENCKQIPVWSSSDGLQIIWDFSFFIDSDFSEVTGKEIKAGFIFLAWADFLSFRKSKTALGLCKGCRNLFPWR